MTRAKTAAMKQILVMMTAVLTCGTGCTVTMPVVDLEKVDKQTIEAAAKVKVFLIGKQAPEFEFVESITTYSTRVRGIDPPATRGNALKQAQVLCAQKGGDALVNVTFSEKGADVAINSWETWILNADVVRLKK